MKRTLAIILAVIMLFALFAACGKKDSSGTTTNGGGTSSSGGGKDIVAGDPVKDETGVTRYPAAEGQNNYVKPEGLNLYTVDKDAVHPSDTATAKMACTGNPSSLCIMSELGSRYAQMPVSIFYDALVYYDSTTNSIIPGLATEWEWIDDLTLRFKLREDVKSHLGDPLTASDVVFTFDWGCSVPSLASTWSSIFDMEKTKVVDTYTVDLGFKYVTPFALYDLCKTSGYPIVVEASVEKLGGKEAAGQNPLMGTGPYKLKEWDQTSQTIYAERNEDYWAALPYYKYFELHTVTDTTARCMGVEAGDFDFAQSPSSNAVIAAIDNSKIATYVTTGAATLRWDLNTDREPLNIKEVRQALALAVNYDAIIQVAYHGYADPGDSIIPYGQDWHSSPAEGEEEYYYYYDIERAKQKLVEAGYPDGFEMAIMFTSGLSDVTAAVEIMQNGLKEIGVTLKLDQYESATYNDLRNKGEYDSILGNTLNSSPSGTIKQIDPRVSNWAGSGWVAGHEDEYYDLMDKCKFTADLDECFAYIAEFQDLYRELCPSITLACAKNYNMVNGNIINIAYDYTGNLYPAATFPAEYLG